MGNKAIAFTKADFIKSILQNASNGKIPTQIAPNNHTSKKRYRIRELRKQQGMTLVELSQLAHISLAYLSRLENGHNKLNEKLLLKLSKAFGCPPSEILGKDSKLFVSSADNNTILTALHVPIHPLKLFSDERQSEIWKCYIDFNEENEEIAIPQALADKKDIIAVRIAFESLTPSYINGETILLADEMPPVTGRPILIMNKNSNSILIGSFCGYNDGEIAIKSEFCKSSIRVKFEIEKTENIKIYSIVGRFDPS